MVNSIIVEYNGHWEEMLPYMECSSHFPQSKSRTWMSVSCTTMVGSSSRSQTDIGGLDAGTSLSRYDCCKSCTDLCAVVEYHMPSIVFHMGCLGFHMPRSQVYKVLCGTQQTVVLSGSREGQIDSQAKLIFDLTSSANSEPFPSYSG